MDATDIFNAHILIVDDQVSNVNMLKQLLAEVGYLRVAATMDPTEVCALHRKNRYDLILLDLQMPGMDGFQVMEALKTNDADSYLPVIVLTAQPGHKLRALEAGAKDFISKPLDMVEVKMRIHNMLEVRLLHRKLEQHNTLLEQAVQERTAELRESEARYRCLTELASDWYWEQDKNESSPGFLARCWKCWGCGWGPWLGTPTLQKSMAGMRPSEANSGPRLRPVSRSWTLTSAA